MRNTFGKIPNWVLLAVSLISLALGAYGMVKIVPLFLQTLGSAPVQTERIIAPDFALFDLDDRKVALSDFRGKKVIVTFWTTWNEISMEQLNIAHSYYANADHDTIVVLAINSQEDGLVVGEVVKQSSIRVPVLLDGEGEVGELYHVGVLPLTIFINTNGFESERFIGLVPFQTIQDAVDRL